MLHTTATDDETGAKLTVVKTKTMHIVLGLAIASLIINVVVMMILWEYTGRTNEVVSETEKQKQRNAAMDEMLLNRAESQKFSYKWACEVAKQKGELCLDSPVWWADPNKYPLLKNDPTGTGLFPRATGE